METTTLAPELLHKMDTYWRAANYLSVGQICLYDNPLLKEPLKLADVKSLVVGHWGTTPSQNFTYVHLNRVIKKYDLGMFYIVGSCHGGPAMATNTYLEGTYSANYYSKSTPDGHGPHEGFPILYTPPVANNPKQIAKDVRRLRDEGRRTKDGDRGWVERTRDEGKLIWPPPDRTELLVIDEADQ